MFYAEKGKGAYLNDEKIAVSNSTDKEFSMVATGFQPDQEIIKKNLELFNRFMKEGYLIRRLGAAAIDLCYTACGRYDAFWEFELNAWDIAAGILIVQEAGGRVTQINGESMEVDSPSIVATNGKMHKNILKLLND